MITQADNNGINTQPPFKASPAACGKVLVVEDETELAKLLSYNLRRKGFSVLVAADGLEACRLIGAEQPDLILLDLMLPLLSGWELCKMVRSHHNPLIAKTPIIMLSALGTTDDRIRGYDTGADLYLPKPYAMKEVLIKVRQLVEQRRVLARMHQEKQALQSWTDLQDQWQQALFHELRNQLLIISGMTEHLQQSNGGHPSRAEQFADQIADHTHYLEILAENYLLVRAMETGPSQLATEPIRLSDLLTEVSQLFKPLVSKKSCELEINCPRNIVLEAHPVAVKIILSTLLDNAFKFQELDGNIAITASTDEQQLRIEVQDDGPGIPETDRPRVFEKFYRSTHSVKNGSGLGLYLGRTLAEAMGGNLFLVDNRLPGSCFVLTLPTTEPARGTQAAISVAQGITGESS